MKLCCLGQDSERFAERVTATLLLLVMTIWECRPIVIDNSGFSEARNLDFLCEISQFLNVTQCNLKNKAKQLAFTCGLD